MKSILINNQSLRTLLLLLSSLVVWSCENLNSKNEIIPRERMEKILYDYFVYLHPPLQQPYIQPAQFQEVTFYILKKHHLVYSSLTQSYKFYMEDGTITELLDNVKSKLLETGIDVKTEK